MAVAVENQISSSRRVLGMVATLIGAVLIGGIIAFAAQYFYLVILYPVIMATAAGTLSAVWNTEQRSHFFVVLSAVVLGLIIYGSYRYGEYLLFLRGLDSDVAVSFWEFTNLTAKLGISISRGSTEIALNESMTWAYWGIELLLVCVVSIWGAFEIRKNLKNNGTIFKQNQ